jgi:hypothetical protein
MGKVEELFGSSPGGIQADVVLGPHVVPMGVDSDKRPPRGL